MDHMKNIVSALVPAGEDFEELWNSIPKSDDDVLRPKVKHLPFEPEDLDMIRKQAQ